MGSVRPTEKQLDFFAGESAGREEALPLLKDGTWGKAEALVFARHLKRGDLSDALDVLGALSNDGARAVLFQTGFAPHSTGNRQSMLESVQVDLIRAARSKMTGVELRDMDRGVAPARGAGSQERPGAFAAPAFGRALQSLQHIMSATAVEIGVAGPAPLDTRQSLQFVGAQAIATGVSGFAIEGITGKFRLPDSVDLASLRTLYGAAGAAVAEADVLAAMPSWSAGRSASRMSSLVDESAARVLRGTLSVAGAEHLQGMLENGTLAKFGQEQGQRLAGQILLQQGIRIDALPVEQIVVRDGLKLVTPEVRGQYVGRIVAQDHRASAIKTSREGALVLAHKDLPKGMDKPQPGDVIHVKFGVDRMQVNVQKNVGRQAAGR